MPALESQEKVRQAVSLLKEYQAANRRVQQAQGAALEVMNRLKTLIGMTGNSVDVQTEVALLIGHAYVAGVMDQ